mmetsp:Transcript_90859/g.189960  ORF Transcript_90859/g.189960 Transcript_90859/m.189960 type:complete len:332 (-) Transcript_90859:29-1024(-)
MSKLLRCSWGAILLLADGAMAIGDLGYMYDCPSFTCPAGQKPAPTLDHQLWSYGCADSPNIFDMGSFDPNNPGDYMNRLKAGGGKLNKCCVERDICKQTCGMTSKWCYENYKKCTTKVCKGNQNCELQAMIADMSLDEDDTPAADVGKGPDRAQCRSYKKSQASACQCVPKDDFRGAVESKLKSFYSSFNPEKLDDSGDLKDSAEVWKKWKGKEGEMLLAVASKYKEKAVTMKEKPKRSPPTTTTTTPASEEEEEEEADEYTSAKADLERRKADAKANEDYDLAQELKDEIAELTKTEIAKLNKLKKEAIEQEEYATAKKLKQKLAKLEEL